VQAAALQADAASVAVAGIRIALGLDHAEVAVAGDRRRSGKRGLPIELECRLVTRGVEDLIADADEPAARAAAAAVTPQVNQPKPLSDHAEGDNAHADEHPPPLDHNLSLLASRGG